MKWTRKDIQILAKKAGGNIRDERVFTMLRMMNSHLENWDKAFLLRNAAHEWAEVERLAADISRTIEEK